MARTHGYATGVFDMFHVGHLNLLNAVAGLCDYLTVAVATDALATQVRGVPPVIPFLERMEIVQSMTMVDNVVVRENTDLVAAWRDLRFDVVFVGPNWRDRAGWQAMEAELGEVGVRIVDLPETASTSSATLLRAHLGGVDD